MRHAAQVEVGQVPGRAEPVLLAQHPLDVSWVTTTRELASSSRMVSRSLAGKSPVTMGVTLRQAKVAGSNGPGGHSGS